MIPERIETFMQVVITLVCLLIVLPLILMIIRKYRRTGKIIQRTKFRQEAKAIILSIELTGLVVSQQTQVKLQLQVLPEKGRNFVAELKELFAIHELVALQTGDAVKVKYNPANNREIALVKEAMAAL